MKIAPILLAIATSPLLCVGIARADAPAPPDAWAMALNCETCHWIDNDGTSVEDGIPSLHGRTSEQLLKKLRDYRADLGDPTIMNRIAKGYTDEQLAAIARYLGGARRGPGTTP